MKKVAILNNGLVDNIAIAAASYINPLWIDITDLIPQPAVGWAYTNGAFIAPDTIEVPPPPPIKHYISVGAFFDRFGALKWAILADSNPGVQALIKDCAVRKFIDLDNAELPYGLDMLTAAGHPIDKAAILTAPIAPNELP